MRLRVSLGVPAAVPGARRYTDSRADSSSPSSSHCSCLSGIECDVRIVVQYTLRIRGSGPPGYRLFCSFLASALHRLPSPQMFGKSGHTYKRPIQA